MTAARAVGTTAGAGAPAYADGHAAAKLLAVQLREAAGSMVAFSTTKRLLREAASMIERLDRETPQLSAGDPKPGPAVKAARE